MENNNQQNQNGTPKILYRPNTDKIIFGVCGGLGEYFNIDPILFRVIFVLFFFCGGTGLVVYLVLAFLIPKNPSTVAPGFNANNDHVDVKKRINELAEELRDLEKSGKIKRRGTARLVIGALFLLFGTSLLLQNFNLIPGFYIDFHTLFNFWPLLFIFLGLSMVLKSL